jgi:CheY-like chemotaxis protein
MVESEVQRKDKTLSSLRIIIAEDNSTNQKVALGQLYTLGYSARVVSNGRDLLQALEKEVVDIILMDCQMPEMDGFAATAEIRRREGTLRHTTIIAMTANALDGDEVRCLAAGMDDYLSKPVKPEALRLKLDHWSKLGVAKGNEASQPDQRSKDIIDQAQLATLRTIPIANFLSELIDLFFREAHSQLEALSAAVRKDDSAEILRLAHLLKGCSANIGATQMNALAEELESKDPARDAAQLLGQLEKEFELVRAALEDERQKEDEVVPALSG